MPSLLDSCPVSLARITLPCHAHERVRADYLSPLSLVHSLPHVSKVSFTSLLKKEGKYFRMYLVWKCRRHVQGVGMNLRCQIFLRGVLGTAVLDTVGHLAAFLTGLSPWMPVALPRSDHQIRLQTLTGVPGGMKMHPPVARQCSLGRLVPKDICSGWENRMVTLAPPAVTSAPCMFQQCHS